METRQRALDEIIAIARAHGLTARDVALALEGTSGLPPPDHRWRGVLVRVLGALGGIFVFAGIGVFIALQWDGMNSAARIIVTLGSGVAAFVLAILACRDVRFEKAATPLILTAAILEATGMLVAFDELGAGGDWRWAGLTTTGTICLQFAAMFGSLRRASALFVMVAFGLLFWWAAFDLLDVDGSAIALVLGAMMLLIAIGLDRSIYRDLSTLWYFLGSALFLGGLFDKLRNTPFEVAFLVVAASFIYVAAIVHSRMLLFVATVGILGYTGYFTGKHFVDSIGWPIALILFGFAMIGLSALAFRIDRDYVRTH